MTMNPDIALAQQLFTFCHISLSKNINIKLNRLKLHDSMTLSFNIVSKKGKKETPTQP